MKFCIGKLLWESFKRRLSGDKYREESLGLLFSPNTRNSFSLLSVLPTNSVASHYLGISKFLQSALLTSSETLITCTFRMTRARSSSVFLHFLVRVFAAKSLVFCSFSCSRRLGLSRNISSSTITWRAARTAWKCLLRDGLLTKRISPLMCIGKLPCLFICELSLSFRWSKTEDIYKKERRVRLPHQTKPVSFKRNTREIVWQIRKVKLERRGQHYVRLWI